MDPNPADLRYGVIAALDARNNGNVRSWLLDPPASDETAEPTNSRLVQRMRYLRDCIAFVSPGSQLVSAIATRVAALERLTDPFELDGVPLLRNDGSRFDFSPRFTRHIHSPFMAYKSRIVDGPHGGVTLDLNVDDLFFAGIREELLSLVVNQNFEDVLRTRFQAATTEKSVECVFSPIRFRSLGLSDEEVSNEPGSYGYIRFQRTGLMHFSPGGLVFGVLPKANV